MKAKEFDKKFDEGKSVVKHLDLSKARRSEQEQKRVNVDSELARDTGISVDSARRYMEYLRLSY